MFEAYSVMQTGKFIIFKGTIITATYNASCILRSPTSVFYRKKLSVLYFTAIQLLFLLLLRGL